MFFNYDKSNLENILCKDLNIKCSIQGKVGYSFLPTPKIKIKNLIVQDFVDKKDTLAKIDNAPSSSISLQNCFFNTFGFFILI